MTFRNNNLNIPQHSQLPRNAPGTQPVLEDYGTPPDRSPGTRSCTLRSIAIPCIPEWNPDTDFFLSKSGYKFGAFGVRLQRYSVRQPVKINSGDTTIILCNETQDSVRYPFRILVHLDPAVRICINNNFRQMVTYKANARLSGPLQQPRFDQQTPRFVLAWQHWPRHPAREPALGEDFAESSR